MKIENENLLKMKINLKLLKYEKRKKGCEIKFFFFSVFFRKGHSKKIHGRGPSFNK